MRDEALIHIGTVVTKRGTGGELVVNLKFSDIAFVEELRTVWLGDSPDYTCPWEVETTRFETKRFFLKLRKVNTVKEADYLKDIQVYLPAHLIDGPLYSSLSGFAVYHAETGDLVGTVREIINEEKQPLLVIMDGEKEHLVPLVDEFMQDIDEDLKIIRITPVEGLLDL